ncbi:hypothetical protein P886_3425 [Alteromonadaceae bacterium 2753L.S.0a.02]|nr:hypothetical protein P886_3425 [Alteromonadaceae bacterium 2753L.S.0a.02]
MDSIGKRTIIAAFLAGAASLILPICGALSVILDDPVYRPDGSIADGAERGAGVFLYYFIWPMLLISIFYFLMLAAYSVKDKVLIVKRLTVGALATCFCLSVIISAFFNSNGLLFQVKTFLIALTALVVGIAPGSLTLWLGHRHA